VELRFEAAKSAAPYIHPKLAAVEHSGPDSGPHVVEIRWRDCERARRPPDRCGDPATARASGLRWRSRPIAR
jgi:hypothetical protein